MWNDYEEAAFSQIMAAGRLERLPAIRLYQRYRGDLTRALQIAHEAGELRVNHNGSGRRAERLKGQFVRLNRPVANQLASGEENHVHAL